MKLNHAVKWANTEFGKFNQRLAMCHAEPPVRNLVSSENGSRGSHYAQPPYLLLGLGLSFNPAAAETVPSAPPSAHVYPDTRIVLSTGSTVTGEPIRYPPGAPAQITAVEITLEPGQQTGWHTHPVPLFGYILEGELTVDYGARGQRTYLKGDGLAEAMSSAVLNKPAKSIIYGLLARAVHLVVHPEALKGGRPWRNAPRPRRSIG
jgi:quercetin dioxygenase-like cupin family protein